MPTTAPGAADTLEQVNVLYDLGRDPGEMFEALSPAVVEVISTALRERRSELGRLARRYPALTAELQAERMRLATADRVVQALRRDHAHAARLASVDSPGEQTAGDPRTDTATAGIGMRDA